MPARTLLARAAALALAACLAAPASARTPRDPAKKASTPAWTRHDGLAAGRFLDALKNRPETVDSLASVPGAFGREHDLGFGFRLREVWINAAGKLGFALKIVYDGRRQPFSFEAKPIVNYAALRPHIDPLIVPVFGAEDVYYWNLEAAAAPLPADSLAAAPTLPPEEVRQALSFYMTPYSGILYGIRGGDAAQLLENRDRFLGLADYLMPNKTRALYLLRSLNPASRLTAAEFIVRHKAAFPDYERLLATTLAHAFASPAKAATMRGANVTEEDARKLVFEYARKEVRRDGRGVLRMY